MHNKENEEKEVESKLDILLSLEDLLSIKSSNQIIKLSFISLFKDFTIKYDKKKHKSKISFFKDYRLMYAIFLLIAVMFSYILSDSSLTIVKLIDIVEFLNNILISLLGIVFTAYALLQAVLSKDVLLSLLTSKANSKKGHRLEQNNFTKINNGFFFLMVLYIIGIVINSLLFVFLKSVDEDWHLKLPQLVNVFLSSIILSFYFFFNLLVIWEIKHFIFNIFHILNVGIILNMDEEDMGK
ncbi:hypothetical protein I6N95_15315 [Vagococcus sp. BWB3-3]|uniref:Uncharacterized protein n=1 Tax=Vagococcus allomyrinae TaxID=2794353 RepID=A0A940SXH7_9ENTE|nr:hypothetical protein [Vagococcus allomyrinae]MBP1042388.1 hypothetical protein [Vagococcus allomyrinae]